MFPQHFLHGETCEKVHIVAGPEFGEDEGKAMTVEGGCHELKTSAARFHNRMTNEPRAMGFEPSKADFDLWMRPQDDHCECVATHMDAIMVFSKDCMTVMERIKRLLI